MAIYSEPAETWPGKVDAVLVIQCLLYIQDRQSFLTKCVTEWLKPGGTLIVVSSSADSFGARVGR